MFSDFLIYRLRPLDRLNAQEVPSECCAQIDANRFLRLLEPLLLHRVRPLFHDGRRVDIRHPRVC